MSRTNRPRLRQAVAVGQPGRARLGGALTGAASAVLRGGHVAEHAQAHEGAGPHRAIVQAAHAAQSPRRTDGLFLLRMQAFSVPAVLSTYVAEKGKETPTCNSSCMHSMIRSNRM